MTVGHVGWPLRPPTTSPHDERDRERARNGLLSRLLKVGGRRKDKGDRNEDFSISGSLGPRGVNPDLSGRTPAAVHVSPHWEDTVSGKRWRVGRARQGEPCLGMRRRMRRG